MVRAASGPYPAELSASSPKMAMPAAGPICSPLSSEVRNGFPKIRFFRDKVRLLDVELRPEDNMRIAKADGRFWFPITRSTDCQGGLRLSHRLKSIQTTHRPLYTHRLLFLPGVVE